MSPFQYDNRPFIGNVIYIRARLLTENNSYIDTNSNQIYLVTSFKSILF